MPAHAYYHEGKRVPSVTTINKFLKGDQEGLLRWANRMGLEGVPLEDARKKATSVGTVVHAILEADARGQPHPDYSALGEEGEHQVTMAMEAWRRWRSRYGFKPLAAECSLVDDELLYGGTLDLAFVEDHVSLMDYKAANAIYPENLCQLAAYGHLWNKHNPDKRIEEYHLIRLGKDNGAFHHASWPASAMEPAWKAFAHARKIYDLEKEIKRQL